MLKIDLAKEVSDFILNNIEDDEDLGETAAKVEDFISGLEGEEEDTEDENESDVAEEPA